MQQFLDYVVSQEDTVITYNASNMKLAAHSNVSYLSKPKAHSCAGGHFFLSSDSKVSQNNRHILVIAHTIKYVVSSAIKPK